MWFWEKKQYLVRTSHLEAVFDRNAVWTLGFLFSFACTEHISQNTPRSFGNLAVICFYKPVNILSTDFHFNLVFSYISFQGNIPIYPMKPLHDLYSHTAKLSQIPDISENDDDTKLLRLNRSYFYMNKMTINTIK